MEREWRTDCWIVHEEQKRMTGSEAAHQHQLNWSPLWNGFGRGVFFFCLTEAAYLAPEFAVLKAMRGENNKKRQQHCQWRLKVTEGRGGSSASVWKSGRPEASDVVSYQCIWLFPPAALSPVSAAALSSSNLFGKGQNCYLVFYLGPAVVGAFPAASGIKKFQIMDLCLSFNQA